MCLRIKYYQLLNLNNMKQSKPLVLEDFGNLPEAILMRRIERLAYYSKDICIRTEQEFVDPVGKPGQRRFQYIVYRDAPGNTGEATILEVVRAYHDDLEGGFEALKSRWLLNYDNR